MEEIFKELEKAGRTDVENLMKWLNDSKVIQTTKDEKVRGLFKEAADQKKVELEQFKTILAQIARDQARTVEQLSKQLAAKTPKVIDAAIVGLKAFKEALKDMK
ncbi:hypothetical protein PYW07_011562 [Mythimna separata]|uniref:Uncharacterized protein n=1 Tax=Mythimna separata TaxID=271217 RepID=A0AAD7Y9V1_MYTSE|nr:hypothetical protein PYW07_011562 [Mythimna separata]